MIIETFQIIFDRDLQKLQSELEMYRDEQAIWHIEQSIANSAGNLCLHLIGNLNAFIGVGLAKTSYVRNRDLEFSLKDIPRASLLQQLEATRKVVEVGLSSISDKDLEGEFPILVWKEKASMEYTLIHLVTHLNYHLGQVNYHRRLLDHQIDRS